MPFSQNKRRTPRQQERRQRILEAARSALSDNGYERLNMRDLAVAAGVSPTTLYNQFENKDTLVLAALSDMLQHIDWDVSATESRGIARVLARAEAVTTCLLYTSPSPRDLSTSRMPSSA